MFIRCRSILCARGSELLSKVAAVLPAGASVINVTFRSLPISFRNVTRSDSRMTPIRVRFKITDEVRCWSFDAQDVPSRHFPPVTCSRNSTDPVMSSAYINSVSDSL